VCFQGPYGFGNTFIFFGLKDNKNAPNMIFTSSRPTVPDEGSVVLGDVFVAHHRRHHPQRIELLHVVEARLLLHLRTRIIFNNFSVSYIKRK
jgi:hypothetical protein